MPYLKFGNLKWFKGGKEWLSLLFSLLLAFFIWSVHNLSLDYSVYLQYKMEVRANMEGRAMESESEELLILRVKASGFYIIQHRIWKNHRLSVSLEPKYMHPVDDNPDGFVVYTNEIKDKISAELGDDVEVEFITTESIHYIVPKINSKKVPVAVRAEVNYQSQYMPTGKMVLRPDSVLIYGQDKYLSKLDSVFTDVISKKRVRRPFQGMTELISYRGIRYSQRQIYYSQDVDRFIETTIEVPVNVVGVPKGKKLLSLPSKINVTFTHSMTSDYGYKPEDFEYVVDFKDFLGSIDSKVIPRQEKIPDGIYSISISPAFVECVYIAK